MIWEWAEVQNLLVGGNDTAEKNRKMETRKTSQKIKIFLDLRRQKINLFFYYSPFMW